MDRGLHPELGDFRDSKLRSSVWTVNKDEHKLLKCLCNTQVWRIVKVGEEDKTLGLLCTYVDDFLFVVR